MRVDQKSLYAPGNILQTLKRCRGYYLAPANAPLVGYAGTYECKEAGEPPKKHYIGFEYFNCAKVERFPYVRKMLAKELVATWPSIMPSVVLGAPMGGILFADSIAEELGCQMVYAEKKTVQSNQDGVRDETQLVFDRHEIDTGDTVVIVEDVCNNFSTTADLIKLIESCGASVLAIACMVNRSGRAEFVPEPGAPAIQVHSLGFFRVQQYRQDDPEVADAVRRGRVVWKPKSRANWAMLTDLMLKG